MKMKTMMAAACVVAALTAAADSPRSVVSLSGKGWLCDGDEVCIPHTWNDVDGADGSPEGDAPPERGMSIAAESYVRKAAHYSRPLPNPTPGRRQFVRFDGVSRVAEVYVNGQFAGRHAGAFTAFAFEVTRLLQPSNNVMDVVVDNKWNPEVAPLSADYTLFGGIYRDVEWIETPQVCIDPVTDGACGVEVDAKADGSVHARIRVLGGPDEERDFRIEKPELWSPENPKLYEETFRIASGDEVKVRFGFRTVEFREDGFYLNGVRRKLRGVNRHQDDVKADDPTRPVVAASDRPAKRALNDIPEQLAFNAYPGWYGDTAMEEDCSNWFAASKRNILCISEYGAGGNPFEHLDPLPAGRLDPGGAIHPEETQVKLHAADLRAIQGEPRLWGAFIWAMFDFAADARREGGKNGINDKGLVTRDRAVKKDVFYFYKANWSKEPVLHVCSQRAEETANATCTVVGFCNAGPVTLVVNGEVVGTQSPDSVKVVTWSDVPLREGENVVVLRASDGLCSRRMIRRRQLPS